MPITPYSGSDFIRVDCCPDFKNADCPQDNRFYLKYSRAEHWIQACGSGNLAALYLLDSLSITQSRLGSDKKPRSYKTPRTYTKLRSDIATMCGLRQAEWYGYAVAPAQFNLVPVDPNIRLANETPTAVYNVNQGDYQLWVYENQGSVRQMQPDFQSICQHTQSAIIVTAPDGVGTSDYVMRYFAPQYGTEEDDATGSANAIAGQYWQWQCNKKTVHGQQLSNKGALIKVARAGVGPLTNLNTVDEMHVFGHVARHC